VTTKCEQSNSHPGASLVIMRKSELTHTELKRYARPWLPWKDCKHTRNRHDVSDTSAHTHTHTNTHK